MTRIALIGMGKMGRTLDTLAAERGLEVVARLDAGDEITNQSLAGAEVAIDFTAPDAAVANIEATLRAGCAIVVGTTGWYQHLPVVIRTVGDVDGALLWAPNFSLGMQLFERLMEEAGRLAAKVQGLDAHMVETHHTAKKDAPSGTALSLARCVEKGLGRKLPITSVRVGSVPGTHELILDGAFEQVRLVHEARDRRVFAEGALVAAQWLVGKKGVFTMKDLLSS